MSEKKVFVITFPVVSHLNAIVNVINELVQTYRVKVVVYDLKKHESLLKKTGCEFRAYEDFNEMDKVKMNGLKTRVETLPPLLHKVLTLTNMNLIKIATEIDIEKPDLILFDTMALHAKWIIRYLEKNYQVFLRDKSAILKTTSAPPTCVVYNTAFARQKNVFPEKADEKLSLAAPLKVKFLSYFINLKLLIRTKILSTKYGIDFIIPMQEMFVNNQNFQQIVFTIPEIQPKASFMHTNINYIGSFFSESLRTAEQRLTDETPLNLKGILEKFKPLNPTESFDNLLNSEYNRLFFVSLGTVFDIGTESYLKIIEAVKMFNNQSSKELGKIGVKINKLNVIMSVGKSCHDDLNKIFQLANYSLPEEIVIVSSAPQTEILKRASLFLTHAGFGSMHESLFYGVPMIAMPIAADQPVNAKYLENDIKACVSLNFRCTSSDQLKNAFEKILTDQSYHESCLKYSKLLKKCNAATNGAKLIKSLF